VLEPKYVVKNGDLLFAWSGTPGTSFGAHIWKGQDAALNQHIFNVKFSRNLINPVFFCHALNYNVTRFVEQAQGGVGLAHITKSKFESSTIPIPPLPEQHRIVNKIEELFTQLDAGVDLLQKTKVLLNQYRQSVLKAAFEGKLTEEWRERNKKKLAAGKLLNQIRLIGGKDKKPITPNEALLSELPHGWVWATIDQLSVVVRGASPRPAGDPRYFGGDIPWITVGSLTADETPYLLNVSYFVTPEGCKRSRYIEPDTLLLTNSGATLGVPKITKIGGCINDGSVALLNVDYPLKLYLYYYLKTLTTSLRNINQGAAQPNLNTGIVRSIAIPLPSVEEQKQIVNHLEDQFATYFDIEKVLILELNRSQALRSAILRKAFQGKLVPQDPADEPASKLLERLKVQRSGETPRGRKPRQTKMF
jgi:type I restriction enzyme, S subunit